MLENHLYNSCIKRNFAASNIAEMKTTFKVGIAAAVWATIVLTAVSASVSSCSSKKKVDRDITSSALILGDDIVAVRSGDGKVSIRNIVTGKTTIKDIELDWTSTSPNDSLAVFCSEDRRGYYNAYTGVIAIPAQYRRAWVFSEGLAAVQKNGMIGFIDHQGNTVIPFRYPYHGNPLSSFTFSHGHCVVADTTGRCGVIDKAGRWEILPEYDDVSAYKEYAIVSKAGVRMQVGYDGRVLNSFVLDSVYRLTYEVKERFENREGEVEYVDKTIDTGMFSYRVGGRCGLMDKDCRRLTEPLYHSICAVNANMFRATLFDGYSEVILNARGEVTK